MSKHEQRIEILVTDFGGVEEKTTERPICNYCWHEGPDGEKRRADWPCSTARAREAVALLNSMVYSGESHTATSLAAVRRAMDDAPAAGRPAREGEGE